MPNVIILFIIITFIFTGCNKTFEPDPTITIGNQVIKAIKKNDKKDN